MKKCIIAGAYPCGKINIANRNDYYIIAADAGFLNLKKSGLTPDLILGDFDSCESIPERKDIIIYPAEKDDTDTLLAVKAGFERGFKEFHIFGGIGGRLDHTFANIQTLEFICENGGKGYLHSDTQTATVIKNTSVKFNKNESGTFSFFSLSPECSGVTETGFKYKLTDAKVKSSFPVGVSNKFCGAEAEITVKNGTALLIWDNNTFNL